MSIGIQPPHKIFTLKRFIGVIIIEINMTMAITRKWCKFFESGNKNILSPNFVTVKAFRSVYNLNTGDYIHQNPIDFICVF